MDNDEIMDWLRWVVITDEAVREAHQQIGQGKVDAMLDWGRDGGAPAKAPERVIIF